MQFDAGALVFKLITVGAQVFRKDQADAEDAVKKTGKAAEDSAKKVDEHGNASERSGRKARATKKPLDEQAQSTKKVGDESKRAAEEQRKQAKAAEEQKTAAEQVSRTLLGIGTAITAVVALSVAGAAQFDKAMANTSAAVMATAAEQEALSEAALDAGADTAYSATEAAAAEEELAKAGIEVADIVEGSLNGALALAAAGQLEVARSAEIMATTLKQYSLEADQASHVSDLLAAGAGKAQGDVDDLALALQYVGPVAAGLGISLEETTGALALFASQGQLGERAGTGLRGVLMSLTAPSELARKTMAEYNVEIFNADGSMKSLAQISQVLQDAFYGLDEAERSAALGTIFGNEQITAARVLYSGGAEDVEEWTAAVDDAGYAAEQAALRQDNLAGDVEKLGGAFETALIRSGSGANDSLRAIVQTVEGALDWFSQLPDEVQQAGLTIGGAGGFAALTAGAAIVVVQKVAEMKASFEGMGTSMRRVSLIAGGAAIALTGVVTVVGLLASAHAEAQARATEYADAIQAGGSAAEEFVADQLAMRDSFLWMDRGSATENARKLGISLEEVTAAVKGSSAEYEAFKERVQEAYEAAGSTLDAGYAMEQLTNKVGSLRDAQAEAERQIADTDSAQSSLTDTNEEGAAVATSAAEAYLEEANAAGELDSQLRDLIGRINDANGVNQDAITANGDYQQTLADVQAQIDNIRNGVEGYGAGLDLATQAGRDNMDMLQAQAEDAQAAADAQLALDGNTTTYIETLEAQRQKFIENAEAITGNREEAEQLADQIFRIPSEKEIEILAQTAQARTEIDGFIRDYAGRSIPIYVQQMRDETGRPVNVGMFADGAVVSYHANGSVSENHIAQIARAGEYRVWAEPETEGETYVPHARSKRARSEAIMAATARILGGEYIPSGARRFADGDVLSAAPTRAGGMSVNFGDINVVGTNLTASEVRAMLREEIEKKFRKGGL